MNNLIASQLSEAGTLMLVGMGFVFAFLTLLIGGIKSIEAVCRRFPGPSSSEETTRPARAAAAKTENSDSIPAPTIAAISAAIHLHRQQQQEKS